MVVFSVKFQNIKFYLSLFLSVFAIVLAVSLIPRESDYVYPEESLPAVRTISEKELKGLSDNEKRVNILSKYGWEVDAEPVEIKEVTIPEKFDAVYKKYNELQISEGFNLSKYKGKQVKRYTYKVNNLEYDGTVLANIILYKDSLIGGDISSAKIDGFVRGLTYGNNFIL